MNVLSEKDLKWSAQHLPAPVRTELPVDDEEENTKLAIEPQKHKVAVPKKVSLAMGLINGTYMRPYSVKTERIEKQ